METKRAAIKERNLHLRLYIADDTARSLNARANLKRICEEHIDGRCHVEIVDIVKSPEAAIRDQIVAVPTLLRKAPKTKGQSKRIVGDLSDTSKVLSALGI